MSTQNRDPVEMQKEIQRLHAELERMKMEEQIRDLQAQLEATQGGEALQQQRAHDNDDDEEEYIEEIIEEEVIEEEVIDDEDEPVVAPAESEPQQGRRRWLGGGKNKAKPAPTFALSTPAPNAAAPVAPAPVAAAGAAPSSNATPPAALPFKARVIPQLPASPAGQETPLELILGPQLYAGGKLIKRSTLACTQDQDLVLLYFAAQWQRECKQFFPCLKDFYCTINSPGNPRCINMECVYVSSDRSLQAFKEYFAKMPWPAMPTGTSDLKNDISQKLKIIDMPTVVVLDVATGHVYTTHAAAEVLELERNNVDQANALVESWKQIPPISMEQVQQDLRLKHGIMARDVLYWA